MYNSENNIRSEDISRCNLILSEFGIYVGYDSGTDIYPTIKVYKKVLTDTSYELILLDDIEFKIEFLVSGGEKRLDFIFSNLDISEIKNTFIFQKNLPSYEKLDINPNLVDIDFDISSKKLSIFGKISNIIGYLVVFLRSYDLSQKVWGFDGSDELFLPKFNIGDHVTTKNDVLEMRVIGYSLGNNGDLLYKCLEIESEFPNVVSEIGVDSLQYSRSHKIEQIINNLPNNQ